MITGLCHSSSLGSLGDFGIWGWSGLILYLLFWVGLIAGLALLVLWRIRRSRAPAATVPNVTGQPTPKEILRARYARGEITREQYEVGKQELDTDKGKESSKGGSQ